MAAVSKKTYDIFVSYSSKDAKLASEIVSAFRDSGLEAFTERDLSPGVNLSEAVWEALAESRALLTIVSPSGPTPSMGIEIGAARAWNKPIYAVVTDPSSTRIPLPLARTHLYTAGRIQDVIDAVKSSIEQLSEDDRGFLVELYSELGIPVDRLALDPTVLEGMVRIFGERRGKVVSGERLLSELLRLRKQGKLAKGRLTGRPRPRSESA